MLFPAHLPPRVGMGREASGYRTDSTHGASWPSGSQAVRSLAHRSKPTTLHHRCSAAPPCQPCPNSRTESILPRLSARSWNGLSGACRTQPRPTPRGSEEPQRGCSQVAVGLTNTNIEKENLATGEQNRPVQTLWETRIIYAIRVFILKESETLLIINSIFRHLSVPRS